MSRTGADAARQMQPADAFRTVSSLAAARRAGSLAGERAGLIDSGLEVGLAVAKGDAALADRHAAIGFPLDAAIDGDELIGRAFDLDLAVHQHLAVAVHGDEIGRAVALAGDDDDAAALQSYVRNQRVSDYDGGDLGRKLHELCLIDIDGDAVGIGRGQADRRPQQDSCNEGTQSEPRACANTLNLERHTLPRGINKPAMAIRSRTGARHGESDDNS